MRNLTFAFLLIFAKTIVAQEYVIDWEDNFDRLNTEKWLVQNNFDHYGGELQVYTNRPENVFVQDGNLILRVLKETYTCPESAVNPWGCARQLNTGKSYAYTSGWVETQPAYNTQYGKIEANILLPYGKGFWPAFWTFVGGGLSSNVNAAEVDIFEMYGHKPPTNLETNVHLEYCNDTRPDYPECNGIPNYGKAHLIPSYANKYHVYALEWSPEFLKWKFDGTTLRVMRNPGVVDPVRIIMNMAILVGDPPNGNTKFPSDIKIDYVKVYKEETSTATPANILKNASISIFPNPAQSTIQVDIGALKKINIQSIEVINLLGQVVKSYPFLQEEVFSLDISKLEKAQYVLKITTGEGIVTQSFIKM